MTSRQFWAVGFVPDVDPDAATILARSAAYSTRNAAAAALFEAYPALTQCYTGTDEKARTLTSFHMRPYP